MALGKAVAAPTRYCTLSKVLGAGSMGKVKLAVHNVTGEKAGVLFST